MGSCRTSGSAELSKRFGGKPPTIAIDDLDLEIEPGEFLVLLGPSGCGKTTTLRCLAGLETAEDGRDRVRRPHGVRRRAGVNVPPNKRNIGMVFQSYALWPHMTVRKNIGYPLRTRRIKGAQATEWIEEVARLVDTTQPARPLPGPAERRPAAAGRALARPRRPPRARPLRRAAQQPRRAAARARAHRDPRAPRAARVHGRLRHARPDRGARARRPAGDHAQRRARAARHARADLRGARERVRRRASSGWRTASSSSGVDGGWTHEGEPVDGDLELRRDARRRRSSPAPAPRTSTSRRADDGRAAGDGPPPATVVDSEFGGRHLDVVVNVGATRVLSRIPAGERGGWARSLEPGQPVVATLSSATSPSTTTPARWSARSAAASRSHADMTTEAVAIPHAPRACGSAAVRRGSHCSRSSARSAT